MELQTSASVFFFHLLLISSNQRQFLQKNKIKFDHKTQRLIRFTNTPSPLLPAGNKKKKIG